MGKRKYNYEIVKEYIEKYNYKLLSKEYKNNRTPLEMKCEKGHIFKCSFDNFKNIKETEDDMLYYLNKYLNSF